MSQGFVPGGGGWFWMKLISALQAQTLRAIYFPLCTIFLNLNFPLGYQEFSVAFVPERCVEIMEMSFCADNIRDQCKTAVNVH